MWLKGIGFALAPRPPFLPYNPSHLPPSPPNPSTDFVASHGVATPDAFWKVLISKDRAIAWIIPNTAEATRKRLDQYLVSIADLEARTGETLTVDDWLKEDVPEVSWMIPVGCDRG